MNVEPAKRAIIYTRISRDDTGEGVANTRQREDCEALARFRHWEIVGVEEDVSISAYSGKRRPAWDRVMEAMRGGTVDVVIAYHVDRITRTVRELSSIVDLCRSTGVGIATVNGDLDLSNDTGKMVATILGAVAEAEVERKGARQRRANQQRATGGHRWRSGWRSFGYEPDGTVIESEAEMIRQAAAEVLDGASLNGIAKRWQDSGVRTPRNAVSGWSHQGVKSILVNPKTAGLATYKGEVTGRGQWDAVLTEQQHVELVAVLTAPDRLTRAGGSNSRRPENLLTGIATCATCHEPVQAGTGSSGTTAAHPIYQCRNYHVSTPREAVDGLVRRSMHAALALERAGKYVPAEHVDTAPLDAEAGRVRDRLNQLSASYATERISIEQLETASAALRTRLGELEAQTVAAAQQGRTERIVIKARATATGWLDASLDEQRELLANIAEITLYPRGRGRRNVPIDQQIVMRLRDRDGNWTPIINERRRTRQARPNDGPNA